MKINNNFLYIMFFCVCGWSPLSNFGMGGIICRWLNGDSSNNVHANNNQLALQKCRNIDNKPEYVQGGYVGSFLCRMLKKEKKVNNNANIRESNQEFNHELDIKEKQNYKKYKDLRKKIDAFIKNNFHKDNLNIKELNELEIELRKNKDMLDHLEKNYKDFAQMYEKELKKDDFYNNNSQESILSANNNINAQNGSFVQAHNENSNIQHSDEILNRSIKLESDLRFSQFKKKNQEIFDQEKDHFPNFSKLFESVIAYEFEKNQSKIAPNESQLK